MMPGTEICNKNIVCTLLELGENAVECGVKYAYDTTKQKLELLEFIFNAKI